MKVLEISHLYPVSYDPLYGIAIHKQIKYLKNKKCEILVISPIPWTPFAIKYFSNKWKLYSKIPNHKNLEGIEIFYPRWLTLPKAYFFDSSGTRMYYGIKRLVKNLYTIFPFDIIHAHMAMPDGYAAMLLSYDYKKPFIVTLQATDLDITANKNLKCFIQLQKVFAHTDKIISPTPRLYDQLHKGFNINSEIVGYGIDRNDIYCKESDLRNKYEKYNILLSVSRLIDSKGIDLNLYALKKLIIKYNNLLYIIIGDGPIKQKLKNLVDTLGLNRNVEFIGQLSHEKVMEYMSICNIFTMPSWQETFGLVYIEAMAHKKAIIGCKGQGVDGIVKDGETGLLVKPKDVDSLVEAMDYLLSNPDKAKKIGERARKLILENYTWEKNAEKTIKVYQEVLNNAR